MNVKEEDKILTEAEQDRAAHYYSYGWGYDEITNSILVCQNEGLQEVLMREVGRVISNHYQKQSYPFEFYGKVEEE